MTGTRMVQVVVAFDAHGMSERREGFVYDRLTAEVLTAVHRLAAAHNDVRFYVGPEDIIADQVGEVVDLLAWDALRAGSVDGRTTPEIAAAVGQPREKVHLILSDPRSGLVLGPDNRWHPKVVQ